MFTHLEDPAPASPDGELVEEIVIEGRRRLRSRRRLVGAAVVVAVGLVGAAAVATLNGDDAPTIYAGGEARVPEFRVLSIIEARDGAGTLRSAVDGDQFRELWVAVGGVDSEGGERLPPVFQGEIVVSITIPDDACPPELVGFDRDGDVLTPRFVETAPCGPEPLIPKTYVVALEREPLVPSFILRLPGDPVYDFDEKRLEVVVPAATSLGDAPSGAPLSNVQWDEVAYPMDCADVGWNVLDVMYTRHGAETAVAVLLVACDAGAGSPPRAIYVYDRAESATEPRLLQALWQDSWRTLLGTLDLDGVELVATGTTYSSQDIPRCCPDGEITVRWRWTERGYAPVGGLPAAVEGVLQMVGGPSLVDPIRVPGVVVALDEDDRVLASAPAQHDGSFTMLLAPGTYRLVGTSPRFQVAGGCVAEEDLTISGADVGGVGVYCAMR